MHRSSGTDETVVTFSVQDGDTVQNILSISTLTGTNREIQTSRGNRFNLSRQSDATYTVELLSGNSEWKYGLTEDQVREAFSDPAGVADPETTDQAERTDTMKKVLVLEDESSIRSFIVINLLPGWL